ncbi:MAG: efflux RND transporter permease subunit [Gammaproteobacteria bacterium]|nr:efflux RND transporter permease subunit [Gammaproteobacteria bacterium]
MRRLVSWFATNPVATNLLVVFLLLAGIASFARIPVQIWPDLDVPVISIVVPYLGAAPEEVETAVCARIDEKLDGIEGVDRIRSTAEEGRCRVLVALLFDADRAAALADVQNQVNAIDTLPKETETPVVRLLSSSDVVVEVAVTGPTDERDLKELARRVRNDLLALPAVTRASIANVRPYEISIEVSETSLQRNQLTFDQVANAIRGNSLDLPGGAVKTDRGELLLRTRGQADGGEEFSRIEVTTRDDGTRVLLEDVARVVDGFADTGQEFRFDGRPAALVRVSQVGNQDLREISAQVRRYVAESGAKYPEDVTLTVWNDQSSLLVERLATLIDSGLQGLLLVLVVLALFLRPHLALWVAAGIPIALLGAVFLLFCFGVSIDAISLIGFILVLGLLVDDAVVVGESAYVAQREGAGQLAGAIEGARRVFVPVTFGVLTTVAAFVPMLFLAGVAGQFMAAVAAPVICCLAFSLIECHVILPLHLGHRSDSMPLGEFGIALLAVALLAAIVLAADGRDAIGLAIGVLCLVLAAHMSGALRWLGTAFARVQVRFERGLETFIQGAFRHLIQWALRRRALTVTSGFVAIGLALAVVAGGHLPFSFLISDQGDRIVAKLSMPFGVPEIETDRALAQLVASARNLQAELAREHGVPIITHIAESHGSHLAGGTGGEDAVPTGSHLGEIYLQLSPSQQREITTVEVADAWRNATGAIEHAEQLVFVTDFRQLAPDIDIRLFGDSMDDLKAVSAAVEAELAGYPGVLEVSKSFREGKEELSLSLTDAGAALGLTLSDVGRQVRQAFYGEEAQRVQRGEDDLRVMVRYPADARRSLGSLQSLHLRTPAGTYVPFRTVAEVEWGRGMQLIERVDSVRSVNVSAKVDLNRTSGNAVLDAMAPFLEATIDGNPDLGYEIESNRALRETVASAAPLFLAALGAVYALLAIPLRSYHQPLIVMAVLPFCFVGAVLGHLLAMIPGIVLGFSMPSAFGLLAAGGVAINASLVLLHGVQRFRADGDAVEAALENAAALRCRPILITTVTSFVGLMPLMLTRSPSAAPMVPMVVSLAFGIVVSSVAALVFVPALWLILHRVGTGTRRTATSLRDLVGRAPRIVQWLARYPFLQDSLESREFTDLLIEDEEGLDPETARIARTGLVRLYYQREFDRHAMGEELSAIAGQAPSTDDLVVETRNWAQQRAFQLGAHMLRGAVEPREAARPLSDILDACLVQALAAVRQDFAKEHGPMRDHLLALVALDAHGRREFAIGGSLRLLFLYDYPDGGAASPSGAQAWHTSLLQRFQRVFGELSPAEMLYEPYPPWHGEGRSPSAYSLRAFDEYYADKPSATDLRTLVHARVVFADGDLGDEFEKSRQAALGRERRLDAVGETLTALRPKRGEGRWEALNAPGALVDIELFVEHLYLVVAAAAPGSAMVAEGLVDTLETGAKQGLIDATAAADLTAATRLLQNFDGFMRMVGVHQDPTLLSPEEQSTLAQACDAEALEDLARLLAATRRRSAAHIDTWFSMHRGRAETEE